MSTVSIPVLDTPRLRLRAPRGSDFDASFAMWTDPAVTRFIGGRASSREEAWGRLLRYLGHWQVMGYGYWVAEDRESGRFVGEIGLADVHRELTPSLDGVPEIGWALAPWAHGRGLATEGVKAVLGWSDGVLRAPKTACIISPQNVPSIRVAEKAGYRELVRTTYKNEPTLVFERKV